MDREVRGPLTAAPTLVFDLDGTLVDTAEDLVAALNVIGQPEGLPHVSLAEGRLMVGRGARALIAEAFERKSRPLPPFDLDRLTAAFLAHYAEHMIDASRLYPNVDQALARFAGDGWALAVCTNKLEALSRRLLGLLGIAGRFAAICGQDTFGFRKPDPRFLLETVRFAGGSPDLAMMVGDSATDVDTARAAGVPIVVVDFGYNAVAAADLGADAVVSDFSELWQTAASLCPRAA
jgi:phosphoglycolate phosphatase